MTVPERFPITVAFDQVFYRLCRVCILNFGSPENVQKFVSSGIAIFQLWRKVPELKQILLHSKPNAKNQFHKMQDIYHRWLLQDF